MRPPIPEDLDEQLRGAVGDQVVLGERRRAVDERHQLHDPRDPVEVSDRGVQRAHQLDRDRPGRRLPLGGGQPRAELPHPRLPVLPRDVPRHVDEVPGAHEGNVDGPGPGQLGEGDAQRLERVVNGHSILRPDTLPHGSA